MKSSSSFFSDIFQLLFSSRRFFAQRYFELSSRQMTALGFVGVFFGILLGNLLTLYFSRYVMNDFLNNQEPYLPLLGNFGLDAKSFLGLLKAQFAYSAMLAALSPVLAYMAPHLFGGALYLFLWLLYRPNNQFEFHRVMECTALALTSMAFYVIPAIGPLIAVIMVGITISRALAAQYKLIGFFKVMSIVSAMYLCFFLTSATLQILAVPLAQMLE